MQPILAAVDGWILAFSAITVIVTIWMGFRSAKTSKTASDFFVAGRSVSVGWNASAISGEYLSAASFMGIAGMVMSSGYDALWYPVCYACGYLFLLLFIAGPLRRFGAYTIPDFAEGRFDSPLFRKIAVCFVLFIGFFYTMPQMKGAGTTLAYIFPGLPYWAGVVLVGAVITLNVALGGMKGITLVQAFQYWIKMFAISVPIFVLMAVYGHYGRQLEVNGTHTAPPLGATQQEIERSISDEIDKAVAQARLAFGDVARKPLPEKAPADSTWLSPFGPLTTKAAKAAKPKISYAGELNRESQSLGLLEPNNLTGRIKKLRWRFDAAKKPDWLGESNGMVSAFALAGAYGHYTVRSERFNSSQIATVKISDRLDSMRIPWEQNEAKPPAQLAAELEAVLRTNGITIIREPGNVFKAFLTKDAVITPIDPKPYSLLYTYSLIIALICGTAGLPHILVRFYTNPDGGAAKRTTMWVMILIGIFYVFPPVFGVMGRNLMPELYNGVGAKGTDKIVLELPRILNEQGRKSEEEKGRVAPRAGDISSAPQLPSSSADSTGTKSSSGIPWGSILSGITCAGAFAAFMSTFSGLLVSMTGALAHDVYGRILKPKSTPEQRMRMFKFAAVLIGFVSILLGSLVEPLEINFMVGQAFAIAAASYFPLLFMSVWWRGMTMKGAAVGMLTGGLCALAAATLTNVSNLALDKGPMGKIFAGFAGMNDFWAQHPLLRILCEQPAIWTVPLAITLMIVVSKATRKDVPSDVRMKMLVLHAPEKLGLKQEYIQEHQGGGH